MLSVRQWEQEDADSGLCRCLDNHTTLDHLNNEQSGSMVVPDNTTVVQQPDNGSSSGLMESSQPGFKEEEEEEQDLAEVELEEVRKLQELVRRLEVQNQTLRNRGSKNIIHGGASSNSNLTASTNFNERLSCAGVTNSHLRLEHSGELGARDFELSPPPDSSSSEEMSPLPVATRLEEEEDAEGDGGLCGGFLTLPCSNGPGQSQVQTQTPESPSQDSYESETLAESDSGVDQTALDEVDVLDLEDECADVEEEDSWLYVSPKKQVADPGPESPLKWCRKVLDHPSPETEVACRTLINRLDQTSRWRNMYSSPSADAGSAGSGLISPGYHKSTNKSLLTCGSSGLMSMQSALSSQSSIDSELSTSDDSISMGYKLQDLTDVQIMARLQEESLRQDYASSSASASRRSSTASLQSLRRGGTYSDQEFDSYSMEDEEDEFCSLPQRRRRFTPSPLGSPRCLSPSTSNHGQEYSNRLGAPRARTPRRSLQGPSPELLKFAKSEEELRHSMPNLAPRTSLRSLEAVRNSRSMEANLQSSGNRMSCLSHSPSTVKAMSPVASMTATRQPSRGLPVIQSSSTGGVRRVQSPGSANGGAYLPGRASSAAGKPAVGRGQAAPAGSTRSRLSQPARRSLGMTKISDESWKDGCY
ncbi:SLAIN motif-containing protein-like isoform X3 [Myripristis murdjan]|uniref:SLAIN motif-containing protein-like isoform X3 n=1 Tax=Myripristis murdjan TaxID=586833 RepID=UPI0011762D0D|nr:SLAIN motif-containing protein-like isoform X3 [Myripristis murdjan]